MTREECIREIIAEIRNPDEYFQYNDTKGKVNKMAVLRGVRKKLRLSFFKKGDNELSMRICEEVIKQLKGSGTTALMAKKLNRKCIGIELNREYIEIIKHRIGAEF